MKELRKVRKSAFHKQKAMQLTRVNIYLKRTPALQELGVQVVWQNDPIRW